MSQFARIFLALVHAGLTAAALVLIRQGERVPAHDATDLVVPAVAAAAILVFWWRRRKIEFVISMGVIVGLQAAASLALVGFFLLFILGAAKVGATGSGSWLFGVLLIFVAGWALKTTVISVVVGFASAGLFDLLRLSRSGMPIGAALALAAIALPIGAVAIQIKKGMGVVDYLTQNDEQHLIPIALSIELTVNGAPMTLDRVIWCQRWLGQKDLQYADTSIALNYNWYPNLKSFGQVLPDGSGVFVIAPDVCREFAPPGESSGPWVPATGYLPLIGWTPDARKLDTFDLYVDGNALHRSDARVQARRVTIERAPRGAPQSAPDAFARIGWQAPSTKPEYAAVYGIAVTSDEWQHHPLLAPRLNNVEQPSFTLSDLPLTFPPYPAPPLSWLFAPRLTVLINRNGGGVAAGPVHGRSGDDLPATVFPLRLKEGEWVAMPDEVGIIVFYPISRIKEDLRHEPLPLDKVIVDGVPLLDAPTPFFYIPSRRILVRLATAEFTLAPIDGPFASR
jgi:hypothetical protein